MATPTDQSPSTAHSAALSSWERLGLWLLLATFLVHGATTEIRGAFLNIRQGDQSVYFRAAYAVRTGEALYSVADLHDWHYIYPPLFAILMVPFAEQPPGVTEAIWTLPPAVSVAVWYVLSLLFLALAVHLLAGALEECSARKTERFSRRWWGLRVAPVLLCLPAIGHTLGRGQVNLLLLLLLAGLGAALLRGQPLRAGFWLAGAIMLKVIPAYLLLLPLWRRDFRCLAGCAAGLLLLAAVPLAVFGPRTGLGYYRQFADRVLFPGIGAGDDKSLAGELTDVTATYSQSLLCIIHKTMYPENEKRPPEATPAVRALHLGLSLALTAAALWSAGWERRLRGPDVVIFLGILVVLMILVSPVCHNHYFCLALPLVMGLLAALWGDRPDLKLGVGWQCLLWGNALANTLPLLPGLEVLRDFGLALYQALALVLAAGLFLHRRDRRAAERVAQPAATALAA